MKVTREMTIGDILKLKPEASEILMRFGMMCLNCGSAQEETLEDAALVHGISVDSLISALDQIEG
jgi:hybrid cluster-associated redox disulfide protein